MEMREKFKAPTLTPNRQEEEKQPTLSSLQGTSMPSLHDFASISTHATNLPVEEQSNTPNRKRPQTDKGEEEQAKQARKEDARTVAKMFLDAAKIQDIGTKRSSTYLSLAANFTEEQIREAAKNGLLENYLANWKSFTSCLPDSDRLFDTFKSGDTQKKVSADRTKDGLASTMQQLGASIKNTAKTGAIYKVAYAAHGFTILARNGQVEVLQSFANAESLGTNIHKNKEKRYSVDEMKTLLTQMVSQNSDERQVAQNSLFAGAVEDNDNKWPDVPCQWEAASLQDDESLDKTIQDKIQKNVELIDELTKKKK